ncbi:MAG: hypothetical protein HC836_30300 [Richelia sp. RM2_1_2]|nr:hypothetical protein [Richelia sp. RM2_1_2]
MSTNRTTHNIIDRPVDVQNAIVSTWTHSIIRTDFIFDGEINMFTDLYNSSPTSESHDMDRLVSDDMWISVSTWVKSRFTCLGKNWHVGSLLIHKRNQGNGKWQFFVPDANQPDGSYDPKVIPYKYIIIPLQVNNDKIR